MKLDIESETWTLAQPVRIATGVLSAQELLVVRLEADGITGRGEGIPIFIYNQTVEEEWARIEALRATITAGIERADLEHLLPPGPARNALDCALFDLEAKRAGSVWKLLDLTPPPSQETFCTIGIDTPEQMAARAEHFRDFPALKLKLDRELILERVAAVRLVAPAARLMIDANQGWTFAELEAVAPRLAELGVEMIEQPLPRYADAELESYTGAVPLCADESIHSRAELAEVARRYQIINIKLDKSGGLSEGLALLEAARALGLGLMVGNMGGSSLSAAPAYVLGSLCQYRDLDGTTLYAVDRPHGMQLERGRVPCFSPELWG